MSQQKSNPTMSSVHVPNADEDLEKATFQPPAAAKNNAQRVLDWKEKHGSEVKGMTSVGWARARQLASGKPISLETVQRMAQFARHRQNASVDAKNKSTPWKDAGHVAWLGWGGDSGVNWAIRTSEKETRKMRKANGARTLYAYRPLLNAEDVIAYYKEQGVETTLLPNDMHVTVAYSKDPILWENFDSIYAENVRIEAGPRSHEVLGEEAFVLCFDGPQMVQDWLHFRVNGASYDYSSYRPHVTLTYSASKRDIEPYSGVLIFGPVRMEEINPPAEIMEKSTNSFQIEADIVKAEQRIVYGWASVVSVDGKPVIDKQGHVITPLEMEKMADAFMLSDRTALQMHTGKSVGTVIHSMPITQSLMKSLGAETNVEGWLIAVKVHSDEVWKSIKDGTLKAFSIGGKGKLTEIKDA